MTVFNLKKQDKFTLFGEKEEREVLGFHSDGNFYNTRSEAAIATNDKEIFIVDTKGNVIEIEDIDTYQRV